eukprot:TRINITY_DN17487_c0_g1_i1.p1 TRINITY_DN17487_c0_g1~~TRINITY_DN17487_c0_g1_i1.p1  ORF type:complete len:172 (+),score=63.52 TRINITY_DN17487_c0_g1_i1:117-632(+)
MGGAGSHNLSPWGGGKMSGANLGWTDPFLLSGPYNTNLEDQMHAVAFARNDVFSDSYPSWYSTRCYLFKRSYENCIMNNYDFSSSGKERCWNEREDLFNCHIRGKELRFQAIFGNMLRTENGERAFVKHHHEWERKYANLDGGDWAERAKIIKAEYEAEGLRGPKYFGDLD